MNIEVTIEQKILFENEIIDYQKVGKEILFFQTKGGIFESKDGGRNIKNMNEKYNCIENKENCPSYIKSHNNEKKIFLSNKRDKNWILTLGKNETIEFIKVFEKAKEIKEFIFHDFMEYGIALVKNENENILYYSNDLKKWDMIDNNVNSFLWINETNEILYEKKIGQNFQLKKFSNFDEIILKTYNSPLEFIEFLDSFYFER
jgi:hypothetical protein